MNSRVDLYTKSVLTLIAACLVALALRSVPLPTATAADAPRAEPQRVQVVGTVDVKIDTSDA
jgi:hypothetical protein